MEEPGCSTHCRRFKTNLGRSLTKNCSHWKMNLWPKSSLWRRRTRTSRSRSTTWRGSLTSTSPRSTRFISNLKTSRTTRRITTILTRSVTSSGWWSKPWAVVNLLKSEPKRQVVQRSLRKMSQGGIQLPARPINKRSRSTISWSSWTKWTE